MTSKCLTVFLVAVYFVQPNYAFFGLDAVVQSLSKSIPDWSFYFKHAYVFTITGEQLRLSREVYANTTQWSEYISERLYYMLMQHIVSADGGAQVFVVNCTSKYQANVTALTLASAEEMANCLIPARKNFTQALMILDDIEANKKETPLVSILAEVCAFFFGRRMRSACGIALTAPEKPLAINLYFGGYASYEICQEAFNQKVFYNPLIKTIVQCTHIY